MSEPTPIELERDAERVRAELSDTAEQLKNKMSPGQLMDEVVNYFKDGDTNALSGEEMPQFMDDHCWNQHEAEGDQRQQQIVTQ